MTPEQFIAKWKLSTLGERQAAQPHFLDLCELLGEPKPEDPDNYCFERGAMKSSGRRGWADVWKRGHFAWEYKGKGANLESALAQLQQYALALENPPLLVVCDLERFLIVTNWTNTVSRRISLRIEDLADPAKREILKQVLADPDRLKPGLTREQITAERALSLAALARDLRARGHNPERVARFLVRLVFCMFAQAIGLLPRQMLTRMLEAAEHNPAEAEALAEQLFRAMATGGWLGFERVRWFNGGLFEATEEEPLALPMDRPQIRTAKAAAERDWSEIDPSILGTLFVQSLDPKRMDDLFRVAGTQDLSAVTFRRSFEQYTDRDKIMKIIEPVIERPLAAEWAGARERIEHLLMPESGRSPTNKARREADTIYKSFLDRLRAFRVLDPACGSGNFLFLALQSLKDLEWRAILDANQLGLHPEIPQVDPRAVLGIDLNPFAIQIARASVWIGHLQWYQHHGLQISGEPILQPLDTIERRDALLAPDGTEAQWPVADAIIGNPPFLGAKLMQSRLGIETTSRLRATFADRLPGFTDLVCYWFEKARAAIVSGASQRAGLVATNSIAKNTNLPVLKRIHHDLVIYEAWRDERWTVEGAAVRVALICFASAASVPGLRQLDGEIVPSINPNLTTGVDVSQAGVLPTNRGRSLLGIQKSGPFDVPGNIARAWLCLPTNPNGRHNCEVLKPYWNGDDLTGRPRDIWIVDLPSGLSEADASSFEAPFEHLRSTPYDPPDEVNALPIVRQKARDEHAKTRWWEPYWPRPEMRRKIEALPRYIVTPETAEHRLFVWLQFPVLPDKNLIMFPRADDAFLGILHSRFHESWSTAHGNRMGQGNQRRYNNSAIFDTYPFPEGLTPDLDAPTWAADPRAQRIAVAARALDESRNNWLNPADLVRREPEVAPGLPDRLLPLDERAAAALKQRTLTNLYNQRPAWLDHLHRELDEAVAAAYGWPADLSDEEILRRLLALNLERART